MGLSRREFAKAEGCSEGAVRYALRQRRLVALSDGTLDESQLGGAWLRNYRPKSKKRAKADVTQPGADISAEVAHHHGWDDPDHEQEVTDGLGLLLLMGSPWRGDPETTGYATAGHGASLLKREAYKLGWREGVAVVAADADPIGPKALNSSMTDQPLTFGLVRALGTAMKVGADPKEAVEFDVSDPILVAEQMIHLAGDIIEEDLKRRRRAAGITSPRDRRNG
ncbi:hypothetical protein GPL21_32685 [Bradyrhizobium pachyrhizi]|uniref:Uncharacterized protein n=1 Tax=Bradyrhizobium pachyrhizi TaxID=280333 RepID=A0A844T172_9BRAD|nr:hypothetical protein [Bradyrhizobium pachyrhizi]MVT69844.1 hypothetical protein [Bradyrhizobium pachyrhizi]